jgi:hypothetical protein
MSSFCLGPCIPWVILDVQQFINCDFPLVGMQSDVWGTVNASGISHITGGNFAQSANTINGWLRDFYGHNRHKFNHTVLLYQRMV